MKSAVLVKKSEILADEKGFSLTGKFFRLVKVLWRKFMVEFFAYDILEKL